MPSSTFVNEGLFGWSSKQPLLQLHHTPARLHAYVQGYTAAEKSLPCEVPTHLTSGCRIYWLRGWRDARNDGDSAGWV